MEDRIIRWASELQSMAQAGLYYSENPFDRERYQRIREIAAEMLAERTGLPLEKVTDLFCGGVGYQTPKVDTRGAVFQDGRILLVRERDGRWAIPGGWCEYNLSPADNTVKELKEGALDGRRWVYRDSPVMAIDEAEARRYDDSLEPMERKHLPSQEEFYIMSHSSVGEEA